MLGRQSALPWGSAKEKKGLLLCPGAPRPAAGQVNMSGVSLEIACENRGDVTELGHGWGVSGAHPIPALFSSLAWTLSF